MRMGTIFDIKRYALHDGPGIRTTVFFKGCPLTCRWCHNPESLMPEPQGIYQKERCVGCGACVEACPEQALMLTDQGVVTDATRCRHCQACAEECPAEARRFIGKNESVENIMAAVCKDIPFYDHSGGGVTFSGGEPLQQADVLLALLDACGQSGIHRAVDTSGYADTELLLEVARRTELFLYDLKLIDPQAHRRYTGVSNRIILGNLEQLARRGAEVTIRLPLIPGINDGIDNIDATGAYLAHLPGIDHVDILPYHNGSRNKYRKLGAAFDADGIEAPGKDRLEEVAQRLKAFDLQVTIGG